MSVWAWVLSAWVVGGVLAVTSAAWGQASQKPQEAEPTATVPAGQAGQRRADQGEAGVRIILAPGAASRPSGGWGLIDQVIAAEETKPQTRDELRKLRELAQAVLGEQVTPQELIKAAQPALLDWLQIDESVSLPAGVPAEEEGAWSGIDPRLREASRWLLWRDVTPENLTMLSAHVLLDWLTDRLSRRLAEHYMRLENLALKCDYYDAFVPGTEPKLEMPETLPKQYSLRIWNQPDRSRVEFFVEGKFVWGVISQRRGDAWYLTEWTPTKREGPYLYWVEYDRRDDLRLVPSHVVAPHVPLACHLAGFALPLIGGDLVTNRTLPLNDYRHWMVRTGRNLLGSVLQYDGVAHSATTRTCHRFTCRQAGDYLGHLYVSVDRRAPYVCQLDGAMVAYSLQGTPVGVGYGRFVFDSFSTDPIDEGRLTAPDVPESRE